MNIKRTLTAILLNTGIILVTIWFWAWFAPVTAMAGIVAASLGNAVTIIYVYTVKA